MSQEPAVGELMAACAAEAVAYAKGKFRVDLDYSEASIEEVEKMLGKLHDALPKGFFNKLMGRGPARKNISQLAKLLGGYVGEVLRRHHGGEWAVDEEILPGVKTICMQNGVGKIFPPGKVYKRIVNGPKENLVAYYVRIVNEHWKPKA